MNKEVFLFKLEKVGFDFSKSDLSKSLISRKIKEFNLDLTKLRLDYKLKIEKHKKINLQNPEYDLVFAFWNKLVQTNETKSLYDKILNESRSILDFLYKFKEDKTKISDIDFLIFSEKIKVYSLILDLFCKNELRSNSKSILFDKKISDIFKKKEKEINWANNEINFEYSDLSDSYVFFQNEFKYEVKLIPLFFILKDFLNESDSDIYPYYLAILNNSEDSKKIRDFWAFNQFLKTIKTKIVKN